MQNTLITNLLGAYVRIIHHPERLHDIATVRAVWINSCFELVATIEVHDKDRVLLTIPVQQLAIIPG